MEYLTTRQLVKPILKEAREKKNWTLDNKEPLRRASKLLDPNWKEEDYFYPGVSHESWKLFLYRMRKIKADIFKAYCKVLELEWEEIAEPSEIQETDLPVVSAAIANPSISNLNFVEGEGAIATNNRGFDCYMNGDLTQANKQFELALKINPYHAASYYNQAWSYEQVGDFDRAIELYRQAALHGFAAAYCNLARLHIIEDKKYDLAVDICRRGLTLVQEDIVETDKIVKAGLFTYLAWAWIYRGRDEEALEKLQEAIELESDRALTHALMAQALDNLGQYTQAFEAWKNYIDKYPKCNCRDKDVWMGKARKRLKE